MKHKKSSSSMKHKNVIGILNYTEQLLIID